MGSRGGPDVKQRTSQDLAYAGIGLAFFYYLTRDPEVLADLTALKDYILTSYMRSDGQGLQWVLEDQIGPSACDGQKKNQDELVSVLDQINAYFLLTTPLITDLQERQRWVDELAHLSKILSSYYDREKNLYLGCRDRPECHDWSLHHNDFGHTIKSFWMLERARWVTGQHKLFSQDAARQVLMRAFLSDEGAWARKALDANSQLDRDKEWWIFAELDQMTATLALRNPALANRYLIHTYDYWFRVFVDHENHEIWPKIPHDPSRGIKLPKAHLWKNAYHSFEHSLVGYITSQALYRQPVVLYYAFIEDPPKDRIQPYYYRGAVRLRSKLPWGVGVSDTISRRYKKQQVSFDSIQ